jgi:transposase
MSVGDAAILKLKSEGLSFREISRRLGKSLGSVTGRYYRPMGIRHASQVAKDAELKSNRKLRRAVRMKERSLAAIQAAIELENCVEFSVAVERAKAAGASLDMIGACCGVSKQAVYKKWRRHGSTGGAA